MRIVASVLVALNCAVLFWSGDAFAGSVTLVLKRVRLVNVPDGAGLTQHESGTVLKGGVAVGDYFLTRRVETFTGARFNTGATHITLFFAPKSGGTSNAPENVTLDGAHDFRSGAFKGSVSATSNPYSWAQNADAFYGTVGTVDEALKINWTGSDQLTLP